MQRRQTRILFILTAVLLLSCQTAFAQAKSEQACQGLLSGSTIYLPLYSHIYFGDGLRPFNLAATASFRNIDSERGLEIIKADYFDSNGKYIRSYVDKPVVLGPLGSADFKIRESDLAGGVGASFTFSWRSASGVLPPLVESVMIGASSGQGISFTSRGVTVRCEPKQ